jgi:HmuY protein
MIKINSFRVAFFSFSVFLLFSACRKREAISLPDNYISFISTEQGIAENENSIVVNLKLSRPTDRDIPVVINITAQGVVYGTDFVTVPAAAAGVLNIIAPSGNNEASFIVKKVANALFDGDEKIEFAINRSESPVLIGTDKKFVLEFKELVASSASMSVNGGGITFPNKVFIDLSANRQTAVLRTNWDLGFYSDAGDFKVILNSSTAMMAKKLTTNDLTQVTAADTAGLSEKLSYSSFDPQVSQLPYVDYPNGDLSKTAIGLVEAAAADNKVFIVNRGTGIGSPAPARGWKKIRILRNATGGYTLQHADIASATFTSVDIPKNEAFFFNYFSFNNGPVPVEPEKTKWDIAWTFFGNVANLGFGEVPFTYQDFVLQNRNVQIVRVLTSVKSYADFSQADITGLTFSTSQSTIGSEWRVGGGPSSGPSIRTDRYYIIKDGNNNYYKMKFTSLTTGGIRGFPEFEYALVKRG